MRSLEKIITPLLSKLLEFSLGGKVYVLSRTNMLLTELQLNFGSSSRVFLVFKKCFAVQL